MESYVFGNAKTDGKPSNILGRYYFIFIEGLFIYIVYESTNI